MSIIIGIDHGYYAIKTAHCSFPAGLTSYGEHEPYTRQGLLEFGGCFFVCGSGRQPIQRDKTVNDNYYLLTLAAIPKDVFQCDPFIVTVDANSPQSRFTIPAGCVTTATNNYMTYNVLDEELEGYLQLIKTDTETGGAVKIANAAFALYRLDEKDRKTRISMIDPASGSATKKTDVFYTDADGLMKTPEKLSLGRYLIEELQGPEGYYNDSAYSVEFEIKSDRVWQVVGNATNDMDEYIVTECEC